MTGQKTVLNGNYFVSEDVANASDYTSSLNCTDNGGTGFDPGSNGVPVSAGHEVVCTYTNSRKPHLTLVKSVVNDNGGTATASQWTLAAAANGDANNFSGAGPSQDHNVTAGVVAIAWTLLNPAVTAAIVGARRPSQIEELAPAADFRLSESELARIEKFLAEHP